MNWLKRGLAALWGQCDFEDLALVVGTAAVTRGAYMWSAAAGWIVLGCILLAIWVILFTAAVIGHRGYHGDRQ